MKKHYSQHSRQDIQETAVKKIAGKKGHCLLNLAPRVGKTKIAIDFIKESTFKKILWVAPSSEIRDKDVPEEFKKWKALTLLKKVTIIHWASLHKQDFSKYDFIVLDEYHLITEKNSIGLIKSKANMLGLSGTHPTEPEKLSILSTLKLRIAYKLSIDEAVSLGIVSPYRINIIEFNLDNTKAQIKAGSKTNPFKTTEYKSYNYLSRRVSQLLYAGGKGAMFMSLARQRALHTYPSRMEAAKKILNKISKEERTLIFTYEIAQSDELCENTYNSKTDETKYNMFQKEEINRLALVNMASIGTTFRNMNNCVIVGTNSKAKNFEQKFCRILIPRENYKAEIYILCAVNTQDEKWVTSAIQNLNPDNIRYINIKNI